MNTKTFIITATIIFTFFFKPLKNTYNGNESEVITNTHSIELIYDCNTGNFGAAITWNPFLLQYQKNAIRNSYNPYGRTPEYIIGFVNSNQEFWSFNLNNMNPGLIPPGTNCRTEVIIDKLEQDEDDGEFEETDYDASSGKD